MSISRGTWRSPSRSSEVRILLQRVSRARVTIEDRISGEIGKGLLAFVGFTGGDDRTTLGWMAEKLVTLRIFSDEAGKMNRSLEESGGAILVVSQFTLYGDTQKGRRPSFVRAAPPGIAIPLYEEFISLLRERSLPVETGEFGADMQVELVNDGPVTILLER